MQIAKTKIIFGHLQFCGLQMYTDSLSDDSLMEQFILLIFLESDPKKRSISFFTITALIFCISVLTTIFKNATYSLVQ